MEASNVMNTISNVSYLRARDPSILAFNRPGISELRTNLGREMSIGCSVSETKEKENNNLRVYLRIKNITEPDFDDLYQISGDTLISKVPPGSQSIMRNMKEGDSLKKMFTFSRIFPPETNQTEIFNTIVKQKVLDFINGENSTLFTYGASGSGKTFTVIGSDKEPGVVPRSLEYLFRTLPQLSKNFVVKPLPAGNVSILDESDYRKEKQARRNLLNASSLDKAQHVRTYTAMQQRLSSEPVGLLEISSEVSITVWVSYAEIYNEQIFDLLTPDPPRGKQKPRLKLGTSNGHTYIKDLTQINVSSGIEAYQILQYGIHKLNCADTCVNARSSRSHSIFTIKLVQFSESNKDVYVSNFHFCDLAGSERLKKTMNVGDRLKESNNINNSLLVLGRCISAIRDSQKQNDNRLVPFRESKLTQLFQRALSGLEDMAMIVNISPKRNMFDETQHVLNFSAIAKDITVERKPVEHVFFKKNSRFSRMVESHNGVASTISEYEENIEELRSTVERLREEILQQQIDFEDREKQISDYLTEGYEKIINDMEVDATRKVKDAENYVKFQYEQKIKNIKSRYETLLQQESERNTVIQLDASDDEEVEELKKEISDLKSKVSELEKIINRLSVENRTKDAEIQKLKEENAAIKEKNYKLEYELQEGVKEYCELKKEFELKVEENFELTNKCVRLEDQLETFKEFSTTRLIHEDDSDSCEDNKENQNPKENSENTMPSSEDHKPVSTSEVTDALKLF